MVTSTVKMNAQQFLLMGEDPPGVRLELVNGEITVSPRPSLDHSYALLALSRLLGAHIEENELGQLFTDVDTVFGEYEVRCPDLLFIRKDRLRLLKGQSVQVRPDLCIEVISPGSVRIDREDKYKQYQDAGVPQYWIIDPIERRVEAFVLKRKKYELGVSGSGGESVELPPFDDLSIPLAKLWRPKK